MPIFPTSAIPAAAASSYSIDQSLRFNDDDSAYLSRTPSSSGDRKKWTVSFWVKRGNLFSGSQIRIFAADSASTPVIQFDNDAFRFDPGTSGQLKTTQLFRDTSAWYHIVCVSDTGNGTTGERGIIYVNGTRVTDFATETYPGLDQEGKWNHTVDHRIGMHPGAGSADFDGYLAEVHWIDGTVYTPSDFGEEDTDYKHWKPKEVTGLTYGTNGYYLPFKHDTTTTGFSIVKYTGNNTDNHAITGVGFQPDLVWTKVRSTGDNHMLWDSIRGANKAIFPDTSGAENDRAGSGYEGVKSFDADGFTLGLWQGPNWGSKTFVAWCWDMGGTTTTPSGGSISSSVRANTAKGQSIVSYTGTGSNATIAHGLTSAPEMIIAKRRNSGEQWAVQHVDTGIQVANLDATGAFYTSTTVWNAVPTSSLFSVGTNAIINQNSSTNIAYCFHSVTGYSSIGSYTGNGSWTGPTVTCGFKPRFVMIKGASFVDGWMMFDSDRSGGSNADDFLTAHSSNAESVNDYNGKIELTATGFHATGNNDAVNKSGGTLIYMAFADTREALLWADKSGKGNDWTANNIDASDDMLDSPTNNFCTMNPLARHPDHALSEGNLKVSCSAGGERGGLGTMSVSSGKWYWEAYVTGTQAYAGFTESHDVGANESGGRGYSNGGALQYRDGTINVYNNGGFISDISENGTQSDNAISAGGIMQIALDLDNNKAWFGVDGTWVNSGNPVTSSNQQFDLTNKPSITPVAFGWGGGGSILNFGQDSSFAASVTAGTETDDNGYGSFKYDVPTGYLALCTNNLPAPAVKPQENFGIKLYTGNGSTQSITGVGFQPDMCWIKSRSHAEGTQVNDAVRGAGTYLVTYGTDAEATVSASFTSFDSDGFSLGADNDTYQVNKNTYTYVAWNWNCPTTFSGNTDGSITSSGRTNTDAGMSIFTYTGTQSNATVGHGLGSIPEMVIFKPLDADNWAVYHKKTTATARMILNSTAAAGTDSVFWQNTEPTSSLITLGNNHSTNSTSGIIAYAFRSIEGYSKVGSYTGNGSADGTFVHCGFQPKYVLLKQSSASGNSWGIFDDERSTYNVIDDHFAADSAAVENVAHSAAKLDFVSNGFKARGTGSILNSSSQTYIFIAFAEYPFKYTTAR